MKDWMYNNYALKIISVIIAVILWASVTDALVPVLNKPKNMTKISGIPIEVGYNHEEYGLLDFKQKAELIIFDNRKSNFIPSSFRLVVDLAAKTAGIHRNVPIQVKGLPSDFKYKIIPRTVTVQLEKKIEREMSLDVELQGKLAEGYKMEELVLSQKIVLLRGLKSTIEQITSVKAVINLGKAMRSKNQIVKLNAFNRYGLVKDVEIYPSSLNIQVSISSVQ